MGRKLLNKKHQMFVLGTAVVGFLITLGAVTFLAQQKLSQLVLGGLGVQFSTKVYASPTFIHSHGTLGQVPLSQESLLQRIKRLGYKQTSSDPLHRGEYFIDDKEVSIFLNGFESPLTNQTALPIQLKPLDHGWLVTDTAGLEIEEVALEPEMAAELSGSDKTRREPATWEEIPVRLGDAVVAVEDADFYHHWGVSLRAVLRATLSNLSGRRGLQGGSTITQQLAKNLFLSPRRTFRRKIAEMLFAFYLEIRYTKEKILTLYLNHIYMGQDGPVSVAGVKAAANFYFGKSLFDLSLSECALLAGVIRSPFRYNPFRDLKNSIERRNFVLQRMRFHNFISDKEYKQAIKEKVRLRNVSPFQNEHDDNDYFIAEVVRQLLPHYGEEEIFRSGLKIYTTMDPLLQRFAQRAVKNTRFQAALVSLDPIHGQVRALVGGKSYKQSQFNRATQANRQPGSAFKPFLYGAALEKGITAATILEDKPRTFSDGKGGKWLPKNVGGLYQGNVSVRQALAHSLNSAALDLIQKIGPESVIEFAKKLGLTSPLNKSMALALGVSEVTLIDLTSAYSPFDNGGYSVAPQIVWAVQDSENNVLEINVSSRTSVLDPALTFMMTSLLQSVVKEGTAQSLPKLGWPYSSAGKTGTTNEGRDGWFIGYTPELLTGVWVGDDNAKSISISGASQALPIWAAFMNNAYKGTEPGLFEQPAGLISVKIDPLSGLTARSGCPNPTEETFIKGTEPTKFCPLHKGGIKGFFQKWFEKK